MLKNNFLGFFSAQKHRPQKPRQPRDKSYFRSYFRRARTVTKVITGDISEIFQEIFQELFPGSGTAVLANGAAIFALQKDWPNGGRHKWPEMMIECHSCVLNGIEGGFSGPQKQIRNIFRISFRRVGSCWFRSKKRHFRRQFSPSNKTEDERSETFLTQYHALDWNLGGFFSRSRITSGIRLEYRPGTKNRPNHVEVTKTWFLVVPLEKTLFST